LVEELQVGEGKVGLGTSESIFGSVNPEVNSEISLKNISPLCPNCSPKVTKVYLDGKRPLKDGGETQRYLCCGCGLRFSVGVEKSLNRKGGIHENAKYAHGEAKNLPFATKLNVAGEKRRRHKPPKLNTLPEHVRGQITEFMAYLERNGYNIDISYPEILAHLACDGADLMDPENVKTVIAQQIKKDKVTPWTNSMKMLATCAYDAFCKMHKIAWERPTYRQDEATVAVPNEKDLDLLISISSKRLATFLLCLKETFADPQEILNCEWIDLKDNILSINHPVKNHYPGKYELTLTLIHMINAMPRKNKRIFPMNYDSAFTCLYLTRKRAAEKFHNPALLQISFKSFRHWGGSMLAIMTNGNVPEMARILRHKSWESTQKYVHVIEFKDDDYETTSVSKHEEILALGKGWQKYDEAVFNGVHYHYYRRLKRFGNHKNIRDTLETKGIGI
jgi:integrase